MRNNMRNTGRNLPLFAAAVLVSAAVAGCSGSKAYKDGTYTARSSVYEGLEDEEFAEFGASGDGYGEVTVTIKDGKITDCSFTTYTTDGEVKGEDYGKRDGSIRNQDYYNKAQRAVKGSQKYAEQLKETGDLKKVDAVTGATISYDEFKEAVELALKQAEK